MANHITSIVRSSPEVLAALRGVDELVDFRVLIPIPPEAAGMTPDYTTTILVDLLVGNVDFQPAEDDWMGNLQLTFLMRLLTERGGIAAFEGKDEFETFLKAVRYQRYEGCFNRQHVIYPSEWLRKHWGPEDNAFGAIEIDGGVQFLTSWTAPLPVVEKLAARFPDQLIDYLWADEDLGRNCGRRIYEHGHVEEVFIEDPVAFALTVTGTDSTDYV